MKAWMVIATLGYMGLSAPAYALTGECLLQVKGHNYIDGRCNIAMEADGSFTIGASERGLPTGFFAMVNVEQKGVAAGYWNETIGAGHAHTRLGTLTQRGGCWTNDEALICAWKLGTRPR